MGFDRRDDPRTTPLPEDDMAYLRPEVQETYRVVADLDAVVDGLYETFDGMEEHGYPIHGDFGGTPLEIRTYIVEGDATLRLSHDSIPEDGTYASRVTLHADSRTRLGELREDVDAAMAEFTPDDSSGVVSRIVAALSR